MLLEMKNIMKLYGELAANKNVNINLKKGEILAIVGENGAGKSTIMKILYGLEQPTSGEIFLNGEKMHFNNPLDAMMHGIGMVQQHFMLFDSMTVAENIVYSKEIRRGIFYDKRKTNEAIKNLSEKYKLAINPEDIVEDCPVGMQQRVEILKVLYQRADIIIFDEPSAVLTPLEVDELLKTLKELAIMGKSLIIITHKLNEVMEVADRVVVMRTGEVVTECMKKDTNAEELSFLMVGRQIVTRVIDPKETADMILKTQNLTLHGDGKRTLDNINIHVDGGEIVGIAGVSGNGQSKLIRCIAGLQRIDEGHVYLQKKDVTNRKIYEIREAGLAYIPEDRYLWGSAVNATLWENALLGYESSYSKKGIFDMKKVYSHGAGLIMKYNVKAGSVFQKMKQLSGGNAQKLIAAREISKNTRLLIACEPTRGIDIGAIEYIHNKLVEKRNQGDGILLVSSELSEIMSLSDRIYVIYEGRICGEFRRGDIDEQKLGFLMAGGELNEN